MLDLELLRSFVSVVDAGGFTRAGERVHRTQSTVSQQIKRLEDDVGQPLLEPQRQGRDADRGRRAAAVLCAAAAGAGGRSARRGGAARQRRRDPARRPRGFRRLSAGETAGGVFALASRPAARRARRPERLSEARSRTRRTRSGAVQARGRRKRRHRGVAGARALGHQQEPSARYAHGLGAADRLSRRLPLPRAARSMRWKAPAAPGTWPIPLPASPASRPRSPPAWA